MNYLCIKSLNKSHRFSGTRMRENRVACSLRQQITGEIAVPGLVDDTDQLLGGAVPSGAMPPSSSSLGKNCNHLLFHGYPGMKPRV